MSHGPPPLAADFFGFNGHVGCDGGPSVMSNDQAAAAVATMAAQLQQQQQQQQSNDDAMMMFFNEQPVTFFDSYEDMPNVLAQQQPGSMFPPPPPRQQSTSTLPPNFGTGVSNSMHLSNTDDSPSRDTEGLDGSTMGGANEPGGGPQPVDSFGSGPGSTTTSGGGGGPSGGALTEFTRRKNWPAKVIEELSDLLQIIEPNGRIRFASPNISSILGYMPDEVAGQSLTEMAHPDDRSVLISDLNACIANASLLRMYVRLRKKDGTYAIVEMVGHAHIAASRFAPNPANKSAFCQAVFLMSRPYPTKNAILLDSFLEHKMENERLRRRIEDLRREEESDDRDDESHAQSQSWVWRQSVDLRSDTASAAPDVTAMAAAAAIASTMANSTATSGANAASTMFSRPDGSNNNNTSMSMPPPMTPLKLSNLGGSTSMMAGGGGPNNAALTRENLEGIAARRADSLCDKMARYESMPGAGNNTGGTPAAGPGTALPRGNTTAPDSMATGAIEVPTPAGGQRVTIGPTGVSTTIPTSTTADTIEMLTGLRYQEGERSRGLSTGNRSPRLIKGDAGIAFSVNRDNRTGDKKKKARLAEEYVCTDCGTLESPEWRKGPSGPKTLCNACGLRWAKKEKREKKKASVGGVGVPGASGSSPLRHED